MIGRREFEEWLKGDDIPPQGPQNRELLPRHGAPLADRLIHVAGSGVTNHRGFSLPHAVVRQPRGSVLVVLGGADPPHALAMRIEALVHHRFDPAIVAECQNGEARRAFRSGKHPVIGKA